MRATTTVGFKRRKQPPAARPTNEETWHRLCLCYDMSPHWRRYRGFREISTMRFHKGGFHKGGWIAVLLTVIMVFAAAPLRAASLEEALAHFATDDYSEIEE